jgi:mannose/fructose/N-acetylgalactosamine-specific phosphotransferase system component IIC
VLAGAGSVLLLYLEMPWIGIGLAALAVALIAHFVSSRGGTRPDDGS